MEEFLMKQLKEAEADFKKTGDEVMNEIDHMDIEHMDLIDHIIAVSDKISDLRHKINRHNGGFVHA